jgi:hypothetical protein
MKATVSIKGNHLDVITGELSTSNFSSETIIFKSKYGTLQFERNLKSSEGHTIHVEPEIRFYVDNDTIYRILFENFTEYEVVGVEIGPDRRDSLKRIYLGDTSPTREAAFKKAKLFFIIDVASYLQNPYGYRGFTYSWTRPDPFDNYLGVTAEDIENYYVGITDITFVPMLKAIILEGKLPTIQLN